MPLTLSREGPWGGFQTVPAAEYAAEANAMAQPDATCYRPFHCGEPGVFLALLAAMFFLRWVSEEWPAMYSRFLNLWWIVLVFCLYFTNADLEGL